MTSPFPDNLLDEVHSLTLACLSGDAGPEEIERLDGLVCGSDAACQVYLQTILDGFFLRRWIAGTDEFRESHDEDRSSAASLRLMTVASEEAVSPNSNEGLALNCGDIKTFDLGSHGSAMNKGGTGAPILPGFLPTPFHAPLTYLSSGWPVAYLIATLILGIGALIGRFTYVSRDEQLADNRPSTAAHCQPEVNPKADIVGRITEMVDCRWNGIAAKSRNVALGHKYELASGLMEITYETGSKVILQGPAAYEVISPNAGFLMAGRLTATVQKKCDQPDRDGAIRRRIVAPVSHQDADGHHHGSRNPIRRGSSEGRPKHGTRLRWNRRSRAPTRRPPVWNAPTHHTRPIGIHRRPSERCHGHRHQTDRIGRRFFCKKDA